MNFYALKLKSWKLEVTHSFQLDYLCTVPSAYPLSNTFFLINLIFSDEILLKTRSSTCEDGEKENTNLPYYRREKQTGEF